MGEHQPESSAQEFTTHMKQAGKAVIKQWGSLIPKEFWVYGRDATREMLLAMRSAVDGTINALDPDAAIPTASKPSASKKKTGSKKKIDIEG